MYKVRLYHNNKLIGEADGFSTAKAADNRPKCGEMLKSV